MQTVNIHEVILPHLTEKARRFAETAVTVVDGTGEIPTIIVSEHVDEGGEDIELTARTLGLICNGEPTEGDFKKFAGMINKSIELGMMEHGVLSPAYAIPLVHEGLRRGAYLVLHGFSRHDMHVLEANNHKLHTPTLITGKKGYFEHDDIAEQ